MKMLADTRGIKIGDKDKEELTEKFSTMPSHPEVPVGFFQPLVSLVLPDLAVMLSVSVSIRTIEH